MTLTIALTLVLCAAPAVEQPSLGLMEFKAEGASPSFTSAVATLTGHELQRLGVFRVVSADTVRELLGVERQRTLLGCTDCTTDLKGLTAFDSLVTGKVTKVGGIGKDPPSFSLTLGLLDVKLSKQLGSTRVAAASEAALLELVSSAVVKVVAPLLRGRQGALVVTAAEAGAAVNLDDTTVGTTPLEGKLSLAAGPHMLQVEKEGFVALRREVRIKPDDTLEETVRLVPSPDTIEAYETRASRMRLGAYIATGVSVAAVASFIVLTLNADRIYGAADQPGTFSYERALLQSGQEEHRTEATKLSSQVQSMQTLSWVGAGVGAAAAVTAIYLFIAGDPPGKYARFRALPSAMITPDGASVALAGSF